MRRKHLLNFASKLRLSRPALRIYDRFINFSHLDFEVNNEESVGSNGDKSKVIFIGMPAKDDEKLFRFSIIAECFKSCGFEPLFIVCDKSLIACKVKHNYGEYICEYCKFTADEFLNKFDHDIVYLSNWTEQYDEYLSISLENGGNEDFNISKYALSSCRKTLKKYELDTSKDYRLFENYYRSGMFVADAFQNLIDTLDVSAVFSYDDKYVETGIPLAVAESNQIPAYSTDSGWYENTLSIGNVSHRDSLPWFEETDMISEILQSPLEPDEHRFVDNKMKERITGGTGQRRKFSSYSNESVDIDEDADTVAMFTNLSWDGSITAGDGPYSYYFNWLEDTIDICAEMDKCELIIKTHPAETIRGTNESVTTWIDDNFAHLPSSIRLLPPDTGVDTYDLIRDIDSGIVYNSTVGLEMAYMGTPVITGGGPHYRGFNITHDPKGKEEYINYLYDIENIHISDDMKSNAKRYWHFLFAGKQIPFEFEKLYRRGRNQDVSQAWMAEIHNDTELNNLVEKSINGEPILASDYGKN